MNYSLRSPSEVNHSPNADNIPETTSYTATFPLCFASENNRLVAPAAIDAKVVPAPARAAASHLPFMMP